MYSNVQNMNKANFTILEDIFPLQNVKENYYGEMGPYNSNRIIPSYDAVVPPPPAAQFINNLEMQYPNAQQVNGVFLPRSTNFEAIARQQIQPEIQYGQFTVPPGFAGGLPYLKNAIRSDIPVVMNPLGIPSSPVLSTPALQQPLSVYPYDHKTLTDFKTVPQNKEGFRFTNGNNTGITCSDIVDHLSKCQQCRQLFSCEKNTYLVLMIMLIVVFITIIFLIRHN
jgi:hypothetical protein